jgi:hypothetical protein
MRRAQECTAPLLIEESRVFQADPFGTLHLHQSELDHDDLLLDVMVIAAEVDAQAMEEWGFVRNMSVERSLAAHH